MKVYKQKLNQLKMTPNNTAPFLGATAFSSATDCSAWVCLALLIMAARSPRVDVDMVLIWKCCHC